MSFLQIFDTLPQNHFSRVRDSRAFEFRVGPNLFGKSDFGLILVLGLQQPPSCWNIIEPKLSSSGMLQVLLCLKGNGSVMVVTEQYAVDVGVNLGPFTHISVSASGKLVALYTPEAGRNLIWILTADFCTELVRFNVSTHAPGPPQQLEWYVPSKPSSRCLL